MEIEIKELNKEEYKNKEYSIDIQNNEVLKIIKNNHGFDLKWEKFEHIETKNLNDLILSDWLDNPLIYGAFINETLVGFVEGFLETWNNRFRITNIIVFDEQNRHLGIGQLLIDKIIEEAKKTSARMIVLETQSYNAKAIRFYLKNAFEIIGFDLYAYDNDAIEENNIRIEMGMKL